MNPTTQILKTKLREKSDLLFKIPEKHSEHPNISKCAILIGAGCSFPTLPLGGGLIKLCQELVFIREILPIKGRQIIDQFMKVPDLNILEQFIKENANGKISFETFIKEKERILVEDILTHKEDHLKKIQQTLPDAKWKDFEASVIEDGKYGFWMNRYDESPKKRQLLIEALVDKKQISGAYILLALLIERGYIKNILTTNFDDFINDALLTYTSTRPRFYADDELSQYISVYSDKPNIIKLHGDYRYSNIKNTTDETLKLSARMEDKLKELLKDFDLIVLGYNGADFSIMNTLQQIKSPDCELLWCGRDEKNVHWRVANLINSTSNSFFIKITSFDDLIVDFYDKFIPDPPDLIKEAEKRQKELTMYVSSFFNKVRDNPRTSSEEKAVLKEKDSFWTLYNKVRSEKDQNQKVNLSNELIDKYPDNASAHALRAEIFHTKKEYDKVKDDLNKSIELDPTNPESYNNRGFANIQLMEYDNAKIDLNKAIDLNPGYTEAFINRGDIFYKLKDYHKAIVDYNKAIALNSSSLIAFNNRAFAFKELKEYQQSILDYSKVIELNPTDPIAYIDRAIVYIKLKDYESALLDYNKAIELEPTEETFFKGRGELWIKLKDYKHAISDFNKSLELNPSYASAYNERGFAYCQLGQNIEAIADFSQAIALAPLDENAFNNRGATYIDLMKFDEAIKDLNKAIEINPSYANPYKHKAKAYFFLHKLDEAIEMVNIAISLNNYYLEAYELRSEIYEKLGEIDKSNEDKATAKKLKETEAN